MSLKHFPVPSARQMAWHKLEFYAFVHFGPNTFTNLEWGLGTEPESIFNPKNLDCNQWVRTFKEAGMKGVVITAKHHDGFCLWPSKYSNHTVANSTWEAGKGDVLRDLSDACKQHGLRFGVYVSPWDRNHAHYGTEAYNQIYVNTLTEVLTQYGPVFEMWFDGANGEGPNGKKQNYDWPLFHKTVRELQPEACMFSDAGPDIRWVGNEEGFSGETNWATLTRANYYPGTSDIENLPTGEEDGTDWLPAECDVSIRPGWFFHENEHPKSVEQLMEIWYKSVGRGSNLILNVPPNRDGLICEVDVQRLLEFKEARTVAFGKVYEVVDLEKEFIQGSKQATITLDFGQQISIECIELEEEIEFGQHVKEFAILAESSSEWREIAKGTTIGVRRLVTFPRTEASKIQVKILDSRDNPILSGITAFDRT